MARAIQSIPACRGATRLRGMVLQEAQRLVPTEGPYKVARAALDAQTEKALADAFPHSAVNAAAKEASKEGGGHGDASGLV